MTTETLTLLAGTILSLGFSYIPGLSDWYRRLGETPDGENDGGTRKRLVMLALLVLAAAGAYALACSGWGAPAGLQVACDQNGALGLARALVLAVIANQSVYKLSPKAVKAVTSARPADDRHLLADDRHLLADDRHLLADDRHLLADDQHLLADDQHLPAPQSER